jgi:hypothetical protein
MTVVHVMAACDHEPEPDSRRCSDADADSAATVYYPNAEQLLSGDWFCPDCGEHTSDSKA